MIRPIGVRTGEGTLATPVGYIGGIVVSTNGIDPCKVVIRNDGPKGEIIFNYSGMEATTFLVETGMRCAKTIHYSITGTGCSVMLYDYVR